MYIKALLICFSISFGMTVVYFYGMYVISCYKRRHTRRVETFEIPRPYYIDWDNRIINRPHRPITFAWDSLTIIGAVDEEKPSAVHDWKKEGF